MTDKLAAGGEELTRELSGHVQSCAGCGTFYAQQAELFRAMDSGLSAMANEPVPASLLPRIRAQMEENISRLGWVSSTLTAAATLAVVLLAIILYPHVLKKPLEKPLTAIATLSKDRPEAHRLGEIAAATGVLPATPKAIHARATRATEVKKTPAAPGVLVLRQEREAFTQFLAEMREERDVAVALTRAAPRKDEQPVEIAELRIDELQVKPLDSAVPDEDLN